jgi:pimeloyl-ACP methyl ester carboxylesterase
VHDVAIVGAGLAGSAAAALYGRRGLDVVLLERERDPPALVVWGRRDPYLKVEQAERQRRAFPSAEVVVLDGSGHWPMLDDPDAVARVVVPFLQRRLE